MTSLNNESNRAIEKNRGVEGDPTIEEDRTADEGWDIATDAPVFEIDDAWYGSDSPIPYIWITAQVIDEDGNVIGRTYITVYPFEEEPDPDGDIALSYGANYYIEGMSYTDPEDRETRIQCFQAAEILYLHAAAKGNVIAHANLGYVYSYDRCEGRYFVDHRSSETEEDYLRPYPREQRAFECFSYAAEHGDAEACYKLGDMHKRGTGCNANPLKAFECYAKAFELSSKERPTVWGSSALRLADAYENGLGCEPDLEKALRYYQQAEVGLDVAVRSGEHFYTRTLANARAAIKRIKQELDGTY